MILDIFSRFDPGFYSFSGAYKIGVFWIISIFRIFLFIIRFWCSPRRLSIGIFSLAGFILIQSRRTTGRKIKGFNRFLAALFIFIIRVNFLGLIPYIFRVSSHLVFSLTFGLPIWLRIVISGALAYSSSFLARLLPGGAPGWLNPFLVLVETVRILVRPVTLSFRLAANISAGHIVLTLIGVYARSAFFSSFFIFLFLIMIQLFYIIFEIGICLIQRYIFCLLASLYRDDHPVR